ncbi:MAG TPA: hypothetical protein VGH15_05855 [Caulobacteraceae bacterium]|jgi:hypothetical protein
MRRLLAPLTLWGGLVAAAIAAPPQPAYVTGSPVTGAIVKASGPQSVTTGDQTGDVTTSGSLVTTIKPSVALTGVPTAPNPASNLDNTTEIATTEWVQSQLFTGTTFSAVGPEFLAHSLRLWNSTAGWWDSIINGDATASANRTLTLTLNNAARAVSLSGDLTVAAAATVSGTNTGDQTITLTGDVIGSGTGSFPTAVKSNLALPGSPTTTTQSPADNSTKIATTAYADASATAAAPTGANPTGTACSSAVNGSSAHFLRSDGAPALCAVGTAGTYGDATHVPQISTDAQGRTSAVSNVAIGACATCVVGPGSATAGDVALYDGTSGKLIKDSGAANLPNGGDITSANCPDTNAIGYAGSPSPADYTTDTTVPCTINGETIVLNSSSAHTLTIDKHATVAYADRTIFDVVNKGTAAWTVTTTSPATITQEGSGVAGNISIPAGIRSRVKFQMMGTDDWDVVNPSGNCTPVAGSPFAGTGASGTISVTSIPAGFQYIHAVIDGRSDTAAGSTPLHLTLNSDSGGNYVNQRVNANNAAVSSPATTLADAFAYVMDVTAASSTTSFPGDSDVVIADYAGSGLFKAVIAHGLILNGAVGTTTVFLQENRSFWKNTAAITRMDFTLNAGNWTTTSKIVVETCQ